MGFETWSTLNSNMIEKDSKVIVAHEAYKAGKRAMNSYWNELIKHPPVDFLKDVYDNAIKYVNDHLGWELPETASGAYNIWHDGKEFVVDVETSDGGVSTIRYKKFLDTIKESGNPDYKLTHDEFNDCFGPGDD